MANESASRWLELKFVIMYFIFMSFMFIVIAGAKIQPISGMSPAQLASVNVVNPTDILGIINKLYVLATVSTAYTVAAFIITPLTIAFVIIIGRWLRDLLPF